MIGSKILHYKIIEQLGEGGMGEVYLAEDEKLHRQVALKFIHKSIREDAEARERLFREARAASQLTHPNIVHINAIEEADDQVFISMEYVEGESLRDAVREGRVPLERALEIAPQVLSAMAAAHAKGIVHRDIKSDNVILASDGRARVLDFGLARPPGSVTVTRYGSSVGTPAYMSPEQVQGLEIDERSDLFSFGCVLYEMVTRQLPFKGAHESAVTYSIVNENPDPISRTTPDAPAGLQKIIDKLLVKDPDRRYQSAEQVMADLDTLQTGHKVRSAAPARRRPRVGTLLAAAFVTVVAVGAFFMMRDRNGEAPQVAMSGDERKMLVVLPFENLGPTDQEYFADGVTEEITTALARLDGLGVISRTSAMKYKGAGKSLPEIGRELGVDYALEGTIRWDKSGEKGRVRVSTQLIRIADDTHLWAETYDRVFEQIFEVQSNIAQDVAQALDVTLLEPDRAALASRPTENMDAYDYYLRGRDRFDRALDPQERELATEMLEKAVALDSTFAAAQAMLARIYANEHFNRINRDMPRLEQAKRAALAALRHAPDQPQGHVAMGYYYYYGGRDYERALEEFAVAEEAEPNNSDMLEAMAYVLRRQGRWDEAIDAMRRAVELDPQSRDKVGALVQMLLRTRRFEEADAAIERGLANNPDFVMLRMMKAVRVLLHPTDPRAGIAILENLKRDFDHPEVTKMLVQFDIIGRDYTRALERMQTIPDEGDVWDRYFNEGLAYYFLGNTSAAQERFEAAREAIEARMEEAGDDDAALLSSYALALAGLHRHAEAIEYANRAVEIMPMSRDQISGAELINNRAIVYTIADDQDKALDDIEFLLSIPAFVTRTLINAHPGFDSLHDHPRYREIITEKLNS